MPSSLSTDQIDLSYCLHIETGISINRLKLPFIHTSPHATKESKPFTLSNSGKISNQDQRAAPSCPPIICSEVRLKLKGHKWRLVSTYQECFGHGPYCGHKNCDTADQGSQNPIFYCWPVPVSFLSPEDVLQIRVIAFLIQLADPFCSP